MLEFNSSISQPGILEIALKRQSFTWSNKQQHPLLEKLDWCFVTQEWVSQFPGTKAHTLERDVSDHVPWTIEIKTCIPKPNVFR
jgi:endonuclease/exonuclease/phosphatase family metal-dependent hydrolase